MRSSLASSIVRLLPASLVTVVVMVAVSSRLLGAPQVWLVSFTINDDFQSADLQDAKVTSDIGIEYPDYRLPPVALNTPSCIEASMDSTGFLHAVLNRKTDSAGTRCNPGGSFRQYYIRVAGATEACNLLLGAYGPGNVVTDLGGCTLVYSDNPRVRVEQLFKKGATSTPLAFLTEMYPGRSLNGRSYEIHALSNVPMAAPNSETRILTYSGQGMLKEFGNGRAKFVAEAFDMDLQITFTRQLLQ